MSCPADVRLVTERGIPELLPMVRGGRPEDHISAVVRDMCIKLGHFAVEEDAIDGERDYTLMELGSAFERAVINGLTQRYIDSDPHRFVNPGELELDGFLGNPDLLDVLLYAIIEIKLTKLSSRHEPDSVKFWKYWVQTAAYCYMLRTTQAFLHVCHLNGNYKDDRSPRYRIYEANFTIDELKKNWRMLTSHAATMRTPVPTKRKLR